MSKNFNLNFFRKIREIIRSFSLIEKVIFVILAILLIGSALLIVIQVNNGFLVDTPNKGGTLHEGIVGTPRFINPLIAVSGADRDLTSLIYSGLTKKNSNGEIVPDLAKDFEISEDGLEYRFRLRDNLEFHDGTKLTIDDVIFTILKAQEPEIESPERADWEGVIIERVSDTEIVFKLRQRYLDFLESTTIGILPRHLWKDILSSGFSLSKHNVEPVGAGPYEVTKIKRDSSNIPQSYTLEAFKDYSLGKPYIDKIVLHFAKNDEELVNMFNEGTIDSLSGIKPEIVQKVQMNNSELIALPLPRVFGIFLNQNENPVLAKSAVREALNASAPKEFIVNDILYGFAKIANDPTPTGINKVVEIGSSEGEDTEVSNESKIEAAKIILEKAGWEKNEDDIYTIEEDDEQMILSLIVSTSNIPELVTTAEKTVENWRAVGIDASLKIFEVSDLNQSVIRPRNFEALLFGMVIDSNSDLYAFWHSSQMSDPGLNITGYANITTDKLLEDLRETEDPEQKRDLLIQFNSNLRQDRPAIFLYTPEFIYIVPKNIKGIEINSITEKRDRFIDIYKWFIETEKVWKIFN